MPSQAILRQPEYPTSLPPYWVTGARTCPHPIALMVSLAGLGQPTASLPRLAHEGPTGEGDTAFVEAAPYPSMQTPDTIGGR